MNRWLGYRDARTIRKAGQRLTATRPATPRANPELTSARLGTRKLRIRKDAVQRVNPESGAVRRITPVRVPRVGGFRPNVRLDAARVRDIRAVPHVPSRQLLGFPNPALRDRFRELSFWLRTRGARQRRESGSWKETFRKK